MKLIQKFPFVCLQPSSLGPGRCVFKTILLFWQALFAHTHIQFSAYQLSEIRGGRALLSWPLRTNQGRVVGIVLVDGRSIVACVMTQERDASTATHHAFNSNPLPTPTPQQHPYALGNMLGPQLWSWEACALLGPDTKEERARRL